jgi:hypothetical protein
MRNVNRILAGNRKGDRPHGRPKHRWEENIKTALKKQDMKICIGLNWLRTGNRR